MSGIFSRASRLLWLASILSLLAAGCVISKDEKVETTLSFDRVADSLKTFDKVVIILKSPGGALIDTIFAGKVNQTADVQKLKAPHWDGGKVIVSITGTKDGKQIYQTETNLDPATGSRDESVIMTPNAALSSSVRSLTLLVGDSLGLPTISVSPGNLLDKVLDWSVSPPELIELGPNYLKAHQSGSGTVTVRLKSNPDVALTIAVAISVSGAVPDSIDIQPDSLSVAAGGAPGTLSAKVFPSAAASAVDWKSADTTIAAVDAAGRVFGKSQGYTSVSATSQVRPKITASVLVTVTGSVPVQSVAFATDSIEISMNGPAADLAVSVLPANSNQALTYTVSDPAKASIKDGKISGLQTGTISVIATSVANTAAKDTLYVKITTTTLIDTIPPSAPRLLGTSPTSALPRWTWSSGGGDGAGVYRSRLTDANFPANAPESPDTAYTLTTAESGTTYTLYVEERDAAGNWSAPASLAIKYDLTKPTVAIVLPQVSGTFITGLESVSLSGTSTGPNPITKIEYTLDAGASNSVTLGEKGSWSIPAFKIANGTTTTVTVTATDNLGNTGQAVLKVLRDSDVPLPPAALVKPTSPTNAPLSSWSWTAGSDGAAGSGLNGNYRWKLNAGPWTETTTASATGVALAEGANTFSVEEQDKAGNWSDALTGAAVLDTKAPDAVTFTGTDGALTADDTPTWSWTPSASNGGIGSYILKLDAGAEFDGGTATSYTPATALADNATHTLTVKEKDQVAGVTGAAKSFSYKVKVNPPGAPTVKSAVAALASGGVTNNPGFTWVSGGGGNGKFRVKVNSEASYRVNGAAQTSFSLAGTDADGTYLVSVSEQDDLGRYGTAGSFTIKLDRTPPVLANAKIVGKSYPLREGYITNAASLALSYTADGTLKTFTCALANNASTLCRDVAQTDAAGNIDTFKVNIWRRSNVEFFTATGTGDGSSWEDATKNLKAEAELGLNKGKEFWVAKGDYSSQQFIFQSTWVNILGGFDATAFPTASTARAKNATFLGAVTLYDFQGGTFDAVRFADLDAHNSTVSTVDCQFQTTDGITFDSTTFTAQNISMVGNASTGDLMDLSNSTVTINGGSILNNSGSGTSGPASIVVPSGSKMTMQGALTVTGNQGTNTYQIMNAGILNIDASVTIDCSTIVNFFGSGSCRGNPL